MEYVGSVPFTVLQMILLNYTIEVNWSKSIIFELFFPYGLNPFQDHKSNKRSNPSKKQPLIHGNPKKKKKKQDRVLSAKARR